MIPIVTPDEMRAIDAAAPEPVEVLVERAGAAVARAALDLLGGAYGRRVVVLAGKGNNGADGRVAARRLAARGVWVRVLDVPAPTQPVPPCDLVIDAAFGTGFRGEWSPPRVPPDVAVLAVDIPSGVDGLTGAAGPGVLAAERTVTFAALKPGLVLPPGRDLAGSVAVVDIGLDVRGVAAHLLTGPDVAALVPRREAGAHKWRAAVWVVAGSPGMHGAARLAARAAQRAGAGMVRSSSPGASPDPLTPTEVVGRGLPLAGWPATVLAEIDRFHAAVVGPGLGREEAVAAGVRDLVARLPVPVVVDGDGLFALAWGRTGVGDLVRGRPAATVLTPHDGEMALLTGHRVGADRFAAARRAAAEWGAVVLLKGPTTVVADPAGRVLVVASGDERLATAGTGDVLSGIVGALLARGMRPFEAAACGAWVHGRAAALGPRDGLVAGDLPDLVPAVWAELAGGPG